MGRFASTVPFYERSRQSYGETFFSAVAEALCERVLSMSSTSPDRVGSDVDVLRDEVRVTLAPFARDGMIEETIEARAAVYAGETGLTP